MMRIRKALLQLEILAGLLWALPTAGAGLSEAHLREGLTQLAALVAAEVPKDARWVLVESQGRRFGIFAQEEDVFRTEGNTFLYHEKPGVEARVMFLSTGTPYTVFAERDGGGRPEPQQQQQGFSGTWKKADVAKDVAAAAEWLTKEIQRAKPAANARLANAPFVDDDGSARQLMLNQQTALFWSALLLHTGNEEEALSLARAALTQADEKRRKALLDGCFDRKASQAFEQVMQDFHEQHNWSKLSDALTKLVSQYPLGWQQRDAVRMLQHYVAERAKLPAVPPLKTASPLSEADQKVLLDWLKELEVGKQMDYSRWSLPVMAGEDSEERRSNDHTRSAFPRSHGLAAVPLLAALLGDNTLTLVDPNRGQGMEYGDNGYYGDRGEDAATRLRSAYERLSKPKTREELAWSLLERVLPSDMRVTQGRSLREMADEVLAWYTSVKDASPPELALAYLEAGDRDGDILKLAMEVTDPKKFARLENSMIEQAQIYDMSSLVPFVEKLGPEKGTAFVAKVRQKLEGELASYSNFGNDQGGQQRKQMESGLKRLETAASGGKKKPDLKEALKLLAAYDPAAPDEDQMEVREIYEEFPKLIRKLGLAERLDVIFAVLPDFKSQSLALNLIHFALRADQDEDGKKPGPEERLALLEHTRPQWQKLLDATDKGQGGGSDDESSGLLIQLVTVIDSLATGEENRNELSQFSILGDRGRAFLRQRATALLAGQKTEMPRANDIKSDDREKLLAEWSKKSADEIGRGLETLPLDQMLALNETLSRSPEIPGGFKEHVVRVQTVQIKDVADAAAWQAFSGRVWSKDMLVALAGQVSTYGGGRLKVQLLRRAPLLGFTLEVSEVPAFRGMWQARQMESMAENWGEKLLKHGRRISAASFQQARSSTQWIWLDSPKTEADKEAPKAGNDDDEAGEALLELREGERKGWQALTKAMENSKALPTYMIFLSAPTAALAKKD